jgi:acetyl esterase/lipase
MIGHMRRMVVGGLICAALAGAVCAPAHSVSITVDRDLVYTSHASGPVKLDVYHPLARSSTLRPALIIAHGGGFVSGASNDKADVATYASRIAANLGWVTYAIDYSLATQLSPAYPAALQDVLAACSWVRATAPYYGVDPARVGMLGFSSGGYLATFAGAYASATGSSSCKLAAVASWSGQYDLPLLYADTSVSQDPAQQVIAAEGLLFFGCSPSVCGSLWQSASPVSWVTPSMPPTMLVSSTNEIIPLDQVQELHSLLVAAGVESPALLLNGTLHAPAYANAAGTPTLLFLSSHLT